MNKIIYHTSDFSVPKCYSGTAPILEINKGEGYYKASKESYIKTGATINGMETMMKRVKEMNKISISSLEIVSPEVLIDYILNIHHSFTKENAVIIYKQVQRVVDIHGKDHPEFAQLHTVFFFFLNDLLNHEKKEEETLFVNIRKMFNKENRRELVGDPAVGLVTETIRLMEREHVIAWKRLMMLRKFTTRFSALSQSSNSCKYLFDKMNEFENDLLMHIYLESYILFPKAIAKEKELME